MSFSDHDLGVITIPSTNSVLDFMADAVEQMMDEAALSSWIVKPKTTVVCLKIRGGEIVQGCDVYIGREVNQGGWHLPTSKWANPYTVRSCDGLPEVAVQRYRSYLIDRRPDLLLQVSELRNKVLGCWCKKRGHEPCHGDVLAELANALY